MSLQEFPVDWEYPLKVLRLLGNRFACLNLEGWACFTFQQGIGVSKPSFSGMSTAKLTRSGFNGFTIIIFLIRPFGRLLFRILLHRFGSLSCHFEIIFFANVEGIYK
jgi:hypothetical protein